MVFWPIPVRSHQCSPIPVEKKIVKIYSSHSPDRAGYDIRVVEWPSAECPVCNRKYEYGDGKVIERNFKPYGQG